VCWYAGRQRKYEYKQHTKLPKMQCSFYTTHTHTHTHAHAIYHNLAGSELGAGNTAGKIRTGSGEVSTNAYLMDRCFSASDPNTEFGWRRTLRRPTNTVCFKHFTIEKLYMSDIPFHFPFFRSSWQVRKSHCCYCQCAAGDKGHVHYVPVAVPIARGEARLMRIKHTSKHV
jgi:hypothetical protein